jgi:hypothetical protein
MSGQSQTGIIIQYLDGKTIQVAGFDKIQNREQVSAITSNYCGLKELPAGLVFPNLVSFNCSANQLVEIPDDMEMPKLRKFWFYNNKIRELPSNLSSRFTCLELLDCSGNLLTQCSEIRLVNLREFNCENNQLTGLHDIMDLPGMKRFVCSGNKLTHLPDAMLGWVNLKYLDYSSNFGKKQMMLSSEQKVFLFDNYVNVSR